jgi:hypothetical protein
MNLFEFMGAHPVLTVILVSIICAFAEAIVEHLTR